MLAAPFLPAFFLANGISLAASRLLDRFLDNPFVGIHHLTFFDWAILIPYFAVLTVLSCYGLHRYKIIRGYWKHRKELPEQAPRHFDELPRVTIQLPIYNELYVVERLI